LCPIRVEFRHIRVDIAVLLKMLGVIDEYIRSYELAEKHPTEKSLDNTFS